MRRALIVGAHGQDGRLLHERLAGEGTDVLPLVRGDIDLRDGRAIRGLLESHPEEIYYLAAHHHSSQDAGGSDELELYRKSVEVHMDGAMCFLDAIRFHSPATRFFYAGSSLVFGNPSAEMQNEETAFDPRCLYGITKASGLRLCRHYREKHGVFAAGGILFNHESPLRHQKFVIPKIIDAALAIARGSTKKLQLGDLSARVDWGYAPDYVDAMIRIIRLAAPGEFVVATGETHTVQEVVETVFAGLKLDWRLHVEESPGILTRRRSTLCGDSSKLLSAAGWQPSVGFHEMLSILVEARRNG